MKVNESRGKDLMVKAEERRILHRVQGGAEKLWVGRSSSRKERKSVTIKEMSRREDWEARLLD